MPAAERRFKAGEAGARNSVSASRPRKRHPGPRPWMPAFCCAPAGMTIKPPLLINGGPVFRISPLWYSHGMSAPADDPILKRFRATLDEMYGDRAERVVLFGSRARGDAHEDSDYDVAVFLRDMTDRAAEMNRLADLSTKIIVDENGPFIHAMPFRAGSYNEPTPLMHEIRTGGIDL